MPSSTEEAVSTLNELIASCKDSENGFRTAAEGVKNSQLKTLFSTYARQRTQFVTELQEEVLRLGDDPEKSSSIAATLHRSWMNIRAAVSSGDEEAMIAEAERGEDAAVRLYRDALHRGLNEEVGALIERQYRQILETHDRIRSMEQRRAA